MIIRRSRDKILLKGNGYLWSALYQMLLHNVIGKNWRHRQTAIKVCQNAERKNSIGKAFKIICSFFQLGVCCLKIETEPNRKDRIFPTHSGINIKNVFKFYEIKNKIYYICKNILQHKCKNCGRLYNTYHRCLISRATFYHKKVYRGKKFDYRKITTTVDDEKPHVSVFFIYDFECFAKDKERLPYLVCCKTYITHHLGNWGCQESAKSVLTDIEKKIKYCIENAILKSGFIINKTCYYLWNHTDTEIVANSIHQVEKHFANYVKNFYINPFVNIHFYSTTFNGKRFDELYSMPGRINDAQFASDMRYIQKNARIFCMRNRVRLRTGMNFILYHIVDLIDFVSVQVPSGNVSEADKKTLDSVAKNFKIEAGKGSCPFKLLDIELNKSKPNKNKILERKDFYFKQKINDSMIGKRYHIFEDTIEYCCQDVIVTEQVLLKFGSYLSVLLKKHLNIDTDLFNSSGAASLTYKCLCTVVNRGEDPSVKMYSVQEPMHSTCKATYFGGRCEILGQGYFTDKTHVIDITSLYPVAYSGPLPCGRPLLMSQEQRDHMNNFLFNSNGIQLRPKDLPAFFSLCSIRHPDDLNLIPSYGIVPIKGNFKGEGDKLVWTNCERDQILNSAQVITLHNFGFKLKILSYENVIFENCLTFAKPVMDCFKKIKHEGEMLIAKNDPAGPLLRNLGKISMNSAYGYLSRKEDGTEIKFFPIDDISENLRKYRRKDCEILNIHYFDKSIAVKIKMKKKNTNAVHIASYVTAWSTYCVSCYLLATPEIIYHGLVPARERPLVIKYSDTDCAHVPPEVRDLFATVIGTTVGTFNENMQDFEFSVKDETGKQNQVYLGLKCYCMYDGHGDEHYILKSKGQPISILFPQLFELINKSKLSISTERSSMSKKIGNFEYQITDSELKRKITSQNIRDHDVVEETDLHRRFIATQTHLTLLKNNFSPKQEDEIILNKNCHGKTGREHDRCKFFRQCCIINT